MWIPLVTPFRHGAVDHVALKALVRRLRDTGIAGFVVCGSTGEAASLDMHEQDAVLATGLAHAAGLPVVMGVCQSHLGHMLARVQGLGHQPLAGLLVAAPPYIRPPQAGLLQWFRAIADASAVPLIVYDIPYRTGVTLELSTLRDLSGHTNIRALKDCGGHLAKTQALIADGALQVLAGDDHQAFTTAALGGAGAIAASAHWNTAEWVACLRSIAAGDLVPARRLWQEIAPWVDLFFSEPNPAPIKALLAVQGWMADELRAPMIAASPALVQRLQELQQLQQSHRPPQASADPSHGHPAAAATGD
ncbi:dihydrodipicolinate synthase family protein [Acidovorax sp. SUPP3334]|uniref:dihydrodipicolinate synthase family protein n=1 Tax=Acidovorax sp. SUPP3334 TaxID=2920881 RepID=UPI0024E08EEF|nr:dihydrodipicolinate synthase family protein [Acidovorax sp. SUPP3334]